MHNSLHISFSGGIKIDFPGLEAIAAFLRENRQSEIDALAVAVQNATEKLRQTSSALKSAVDSDNKEK